jgi:hypothetical protein
VVITRRNALGDNKNMCNKCQIKFECYTGMFDYTRYYDNPHRDGTYPTVLTWLAFNTNKYYSLFRF